MKEPLNFFHTAAAIGPLAAAVLLFLLAANLVCGQYSSTKSVSTSASTQSEVDKHRDPLATDTKHCQREFENGQIRVLHVTLGSNEALPVHDAPNTLLVCISGCHIRLERPDRRIHDVHMDNGETRWIPLYTRSE